MNKINVVFYISVLELQLIHEIYQAFDENKYTLGIFIDLSKAFDTVNHNILLEKLTNYGIENSNLAWFKNYLSNRKQYVAHTEGKTDLEKELPVEFHRVLY